MSVLSRAQFEQQALADQVTVLRPYFREHVVIEEASTLDEVCCGGLIIATLRMMLSGASQSAAVKV